MGKRREYRHHLIANSSERLQRFRFTSKGLRQIAADSQQPGRPFRNHMCKHVFRCDQDSVVIFATDGTVNSERGSSSDLCGLCILCGGVFDGISGFKLPACRFNHEDFRRSASTSHGKSGILLYVSSFRSSSGSPCRVLAVARPGLVVFQNRRDGPSVPE